MTVFRVHAVACQRAEQQDVQLGIEVERDVVWVDEVLDREADVKRDHGGGDRFGAVRLARGGGFDHLFAAGAVAASERGGELAHALVASRLGEALDSEAK